MTDLQPGTPAVPGVTWYRKKPCEVEAIQWTGANFATVKEFASGALGAGEVMRGALPLWVVKSRALCHVQRDGWIIREADGSGFYWLTADAFATAYEPADGPLILPPEVRLAALRDLCDSIAGSVPEGETATVAVSRVLAIIGSEEENREH